MSLFGFTKACKFYIPGVPNSCRGGDSCAFLHDDSKETRKSSDGQGPSVTTGNSSFGKKFNYVTKKTDSPPASISKARGAVTRKTSKETDDSVDSADSDDMDDFVDANDESFECEEDGDDDYSQLADLSPEDIASFEEEEFTLGSIPLDPPPRSLV